MEIKCKKITCGYNDCTSCMAKDILVNKKLECTTFTKHDKSKKIEKLKKQNYFETSGELTGFKRTKTKKIKCECSECLFNENNLCSANGITLLSNEKSCFCATHLNK